MLQTLLLFIKKDFWEESSYKFSFFIKLFKVIFTVAILFYFSLFIENKGVDIGEFRLFEYLFIGHLFYEFLLPNLKKYSSTIIIEQYKGTLEYLFNSSRHPYFILFSSHLYHAIFNYMLMCIYLILGVFFFDLSIVLNGLTVFTFHLSLLLLYFYLFSWGMIGASISLLIKRVDPLTPAITYYFIFAGSLYFPSHFLPEWIRIFHVLFPIQEAIELMRSIAYQGLFLSENFLLLFMHFIILFFASIFVFNLSLKLSKKYGSLSTY